MVVDLVVKVLLHRRLFVEESCITINPRRNNSSRGIIRLPPIPDIIIHIINILAVVVLDISTVQVVSPRTELGMAVAMLLVVDTITIRPTVTRNVIQVMDMEIGVGIVLEYGIRW